MKLGFGIAVVCSTFSITQAFAHHSTQAPRRTSPHSIGGISELTMSLDATQLPPVLAANPSMLFALRADANIWVRPWIAIVAGLPLQAVEDNNRTVGLGNASLGSNLRGLYRYGFELQAGVDVRFPKLGDSGGDTQSALVPHLVVARRGRVTPYIGATVVLGIGGQTAVDMTIPKKFRPRQNEDEVLAFVGTSANRGRLEGLVELKGARTLFGENSSLYVAALVGAGIHISKGRTIRSTFELPWRSANRIRWSAGLAFTQSL